MKQTIEIDPALIPEGREVFAYRKPESEEEIVTSDGEHRVVVHGGNTACLIVRPAWQWPEWLPDGWVFQKQSELWFWVDAEPFRTNLCWNFKVPRYKIVCLSHLNFQPPPCNDWRQSKRQKPEE